jgi:hypothetical protein
MSDILSKSVRLPTLRGGYWGVWVTVALWKNYRWMWEKYKEGEEGGRGATYRDVSSMKKGGKEQPTEMRVV